MKKLIFFDIDGTLRSNKNKAILPQTKALIKELSKDPNVVLGIATGRSYARLGVLKELRPLFKYLVLCNGALTMQAQKKQEEKVLNGVYFDQKDIMQVEKAAATNGVALTLFTLDEIFAIDLQKDQKLKNISNFKGEQKLVLNDAFFKQQKVYQMVLLNYKENDKENDKEKIKHFLKDMPQLKAYFWDSGFVDIMYQKIDKSYGIKQIKALYPNHQLICMGDGPNDFEMLKLADVAITMGNTKIKDLKKIANFVSPHIDEDRMYDFFKTKKII
ncbi:putative hydrolase of the HAD superfamily [Aster yellows witches'-broom phytoplasma AYWB]|uniref:Hydrolase of the HAD superfamily n=2 Tax=16SrI (Aster yellows group) TaxID=3042590 RepID=Q2NK26_AYWBP|nr:MULTISPECIES: HAD-IIB family hydrolase [16SrI (Aster yellows group)]ABC65217.1 putative hydrolase of the HAD superfamily [Aster yellows witches'-broom phytoplasma AYWB]PEH36421.1 hydrolase [New Jersey aster yellows phytoplasma]